MVPLSFRMPDREFTLNVELRDQTLDRFLDELRIVSPLLAAQVGDAVASRDAVLELEQEEIEYVAAAARVVWRSGLVDDPELEQMAHL